jgi:hypothetical protein
MNSPATQSTAAASGGVSLAVIVLLQWALSLAGLQITPDVAAAMGAVLAACVHYLIVSKIIPDPDSPDILPNPKETHT